MQLTSFQETYHYAFYLNSSAPKCYVIGFTPNDDRDLFILMKILGRPLDLSNSPCFSVGWSEVFLTFTPNIFIFISFQIYSLKFTSQITLAKLMDFFLSEIAYISIYDISLKKIPSNSIHTRVQMYYTLHINEIQMNKFV